MLHLIFTEYKKIFTDRGAILVLFLAVFAYAFFYVQPYSNQVVNKTPIAIIDEDKSNISRTLLKMINQNELVNIVYEGDSLAILEKEIYKRTAYGIIYIPKNFEKDIYRAKETSVTVYVDASYFMIFSQIFSGLNQSIRTLGAQIEVKNLMGKGETFNSSVGMVSPISLNTISLFNTTNSYLTYIVPSVLILILQQTLLIGIGLVMATSREKNEDISNINPLTRLLSITFTYYSLYMMYIFIYFSLIYNFNDLSLKSNFLDLFIFSSLFVLAVVLLGICLSYLFKKRESSIQILLFTAIVFLFLSGFSWPKESIPTVIYSLSFIVPSSSAIIGFLKINQMGASLSHVAFEVKILISLIVVYGLLAYYLLKKREF